jgi:hypothetical protein
MSDNHKLYFIPIIARAIESTNQKRAMIEAFDKIVEFGEKREYKEGYRQFSEFIKATFMVTDEEDDQKIELIKIAIRRLIYDLVTDTFEGDEKQKEALVAAFKNNPQWNNEFNRIENEAQPFLAPEMPIEIELLIGENLVESFLISNIPTTISSIFPGNYVIRFSNGRFIWEGEISREDVIWTYAFPQKDFPMAAKTETLQQEPTRKISLLDGELVIHVFAGLESGRLLIKSGKNY